MSERTGVITFKGNGMTLVGDEVKVGDTLPDAEATGTDLSPVKASDFRGKVLVISAVPSVDTPVCDLQSKRFNEEAGKLGDGAAVLTVSMDLPMAFKRWCADTGSESLVCASDYKDHGFGTAYGLRIKELGLLTRAVIVADKDGKVVHAETVGEVTEHPDYDAALAAAKAAL